MLFKINLSLSFDVFVEGLSLARKEIQCQVIHCRGNIFVCHPEVLQLAISKTNKKKEISL